MKRTALVLVVLVLVVAVALPPLFGARARALIESDVASIGEALAPYATVDIAFEEWDVGWYTSTASVAVDVAVADRPGVPPGLVDLPQFSTTLPQLITLRHGPVLTGLIAGLGWGSVETVIDASLIPLLQAFQDATGLDRIAHLGLSVGFVGRAAFRMEMPAFVYEASGLEYDFGGIELSGSVSGGTVGLDGEFGGFAVARQASPVASVGRITWSGSSSMAPRYPGLWLGGGRVDVARAMVAGDQAGQRLEIADLRMQGASEVEGDRYVARGHYEAKEMHVADVQLDALVLDFAMRCDVEAMAELAKAGYTLDVATTQAQFEMVNRLFTERFAFDIKNLGFAHEGRTASATLLIEFRGDELPEGFEFGPTMDYTAIIPLVAANLDLSFHTELLSGLGNEPTHGLVRALARQEFVRESGDDYALNVGFANGGLTVNGDPFEPFELMGLLGGP